MIELKGIEVTFHPGSVLETRALHGVDLAIPKGQIDPGHTAGEAALVEAWGPK